MGGSKLFWNEIMARERIHTTSLPAEKKLDSLAKVKKFLKEKGN